MKLVAFDGDDTLWTPLSGVNLSDRTPTDALGHDGFLYSPVDGEPLVVRRDDGALFSLRPEAREVLNTLRQRAVLVGVISYNHLENVRSILAAFGLLESINYIVAEWHTGKDLMLNKMLAAARLDGNNLDPCDVLLVDDDPEQIYRGQCVSLGAGFTRFGIDITDLREVLSLS